MPKKKGYYTTKEIKNMFEVRQGHGCTIICGKREPWYVRWNPIKRMKYRLNCLSSERGIRDFKRESIKSGSYPEQYIGDLRKRKWVDWVFTGEEPYLNWRSR